MTKIFVYGTLKRGECRAPHLAGQRFCSLARTVSDYRIYQVADYPGLVEVGPGKGLSIEGEVWQVDTAGIRRLDEVEGVDEGYYQRRPIRLSSVPEEWFVQAYFYLKSWQGCPDCGHSWSSK